MKLRKIFFMIKHNRCSRTQQEWLPGTQWAKPTSNFVGKQFKLLKSTSRKNLNITDLQTMCRYLRYRYPDICFNRYGNKAYRQKLICIPREIPLTARLCCGYSWAMKDELVNSDTGLTLKPEADAGLAQLTTGKNANDRLTFPHVCHVWESSQSTALQLLTSDTHPVLMFIVRLILPFNILCVH